MSKLNFIEVFKTPYFSIEAASVNYKKSHPYYRINTSDSVICCILNSNDDLLLVRQMRQNLGYETIEFPAGGVEENEVPIAAAEREVQEELNCNAKFIYLGSYRLMMNRTMNKEHLFVGLAQDCDASREPEEGISTVKIPRKNFIDFVQKNNIEQLAALGILNLINIKFDINFLKDDSVIDRIWPKSSIES